MPPEKQLAEFAELSRKYPDQLHCDANEIEVWNEDARRLHEAKSVTGGEPKKSES